MPLIVPGVVLGTSIYVFQIETEIATGLPLLGIDRRADRRACADRHPVGRAARHREPCGLRSDDRGGGEESRRDAVDTFRRVTLPAIRPGIVAGALFGFVTSFGNLEMSLFLVGAGPHHAADRDPAISRMEDRSDGRGRLGDADRADRRRDDRHRPLREDFAGGLTHGAARTHQPLEALRRARRGRRRDARCRRRRVPGAARALRLRQDHDLAHDRGLRRAERRQRRASAAPTSPICRPGGATPAWCSRATRCFRT